MIELNGKVDESGKAKIYHRKEMEDWFAKNAGKDFTIKLERKKKSRSSMQNAYYWGVVLPTVRDRLAELGNEFSLQDTHEALKAKFNLVEIKNNDEVSDEFVQSTSKLSTTEFMDYIDKVQRWANQFLGIIIPQPNEQIKLYE